MLDAAYAFGICKNAELAGLHGQRAISLAAAERPLAAFHDNLTSVKVMLLCLSVWLSICLPACLSICPSVCLPHPDTDTTNQGGHPDIACFYICLSASYQVSASYQKCCQEIVVYVCAFACSLT